LAASRAAASVSLTIGATFATLLVAGGILAGPAIVDCSRQPDGVGACLRAKFDQSGLRQHALVPPAPSAVPETPASVAPPTLAEARPQGWLEANATEYEPPASMGTASLVAPVGRVDAIGSLGVPPVVPGEVAVTSPQGSLAAGGRMSSAAPDPVADIALVEPAGRLTANGSAVAQPDTAITSRGAEPAVARGTALITGSIGGASAPHGTATLEATLEPPAAAPLPIEIRLPPAPIRPKPVARPAPPRAAAAVPARTGPRRVIKADPRYPNVIVLPPPNTGENSSFATLEVR
jgi:hypothetical protein